MEEIESENIVLKDDDIFIYIPATRYYLFACSLLVGALLLIGSYVFLYFNMPVTFHSFWSKGSLVYLGLVMLALLLITYEFLKLRKRFKSPQMLIGKNLVHFKLDSKGGPLLTCNYVSLKYKDIISASYSPTRDCSRTLTFLTATQLYPVGLILESGEKEMVCQILRSKLGSDNETTKRTEINLYRNFLQN